MPIDGSRRSINSITIRIIRPHRRTGSEAGNHLHTDFILTGTEKPVAYQACALPPLCRVFIIIPVRIEHDNSAAGTLSPNDTGRTSKPRILPCHAILSPTIIDDRPIFTDIFLSPEIAEKYTFNFRLLCPWGFDCFHGRVWNFCRIRNRIGVFIGRIAISAARSKNTEYHGKAQYPCNYFYSLFHDSPVFSSETFQYSSPERSFLPPSLQRCANRLRCYSRL